MVLEGAQANALLTEGRDETDGGIRETNRWPLSAGTSPHLQGLAEAAGLGHRGDGRGAGRPSLLSERGPRGPAPPLVCFRRGFREAHPRLDSHRRPEARLPAMCMERKGLEVTLRPRILTPQTSGRRTLEKGSPLGLRGWWREKRASNKTITARRLTALCYPGPRSGYKTLQNHSARMLHPPWGSAPPRHRVRWGTQSPLNQAPHEGSWEG